MINTDKTLCAKKSLYGIPRNKICSYICFTNDLKDNVFENKFYSVVQFTFQVPVTIKKKYTNVFLAKKKNNIRYVIVSMKVR